MKENGRKIVEVTVRKGTLSSVYVSVLREAGEESENYRIVVTSTSRTPYDQARIMFENMDRNGVEEQKRTYRAPGREVIAVYEELSAKNKGKREIVYAMEQKSVGPAGIPAGDTAESIASVGRKRMFSHRILENEKDIVR